MLRAARQLKGIHGHLQRFQREQARAQGRTPRAIQTELALDALQREIHYVLLNYLSLDAPEVQQRLTAALERSRQTLSLLDG